MSVAFYCLQWADYQHSDCTCGSVVCTAAVAVADWCVVCGGSEVWSRGEQAETAAVTVADWCVVCGGSEVWSRENRLRLRRVETLAVLGGRRAVPPPVPSRPSRVGPA